MKAKCSMNDLISRSALLEEFGEEPYCWFEYDDAEIQQHNDWLYYTDCVKKSSAVDAVEVVRCKDCKHRDPEDKRCDHHMGGNIPFSRKDDDFCSYGERKVDE